MKGHCITGRLHLLLQLLRIINVVPNAAALPMLTSHLTDIKPSEEFDLNFLPATSARNPGMMAKWDNDTDHNSLIMLTNSSNDDETKTSIQTTLPSITQRWDNPCNVRTSGLTEQTLPRNESLMSILVSISYATWVSQRELESAERSLTYSPGIVDILNDQSFRITTLSNGSLVKQMLATENGTVILPHLLTQYTDLAKLAMHFDHLLTTIDSTHSRDDDFRLSLSRVMTSLYVIMCSYCIAITNEGGSIPIFGASRPYLSTDFLAELGNTYEYLEASMDTYVLLKEQLDFLKKCESFLNDHLHQ